MHPHHVLCSNPVSVSEERVEGVGIGGETRRVGGGDSLQATPFHMHGWVWPHPFLRCMQRVCLETRGSGVGEGIHTDCNELEYTSYDQHIRIAHSSVKHTDCGAWFLQQKKR